jgi:glycosyltransferase involved in cell wall biosynthesis
MHITVTIPVFNRAHLVGATIESVINQDYQDFDLLVIDDASTDNTVEVVRSYCQRDQRIKLIVNPKNLGLTRNWNRCLEMAIGPLVEILLSDDLIDPEYLSVVDNVFSRYPSLGFVAASCRYIDISGKEIHPGRVLSPGLYKAGDEALLFLLQRDIPHVSSIVCKKECYEKLGGFDERIWHGPDFEMDARLASAYDFYHLGDIYTSFRRHGTNMGNLEYQREDFLEVDLLKRKMAWNHLSIDARQHIGISNLDQYLKKEEAQVALIGSIVCIAYSHPKLSRHYLLQALRFRLRILFTAKFWKAFSLNLFPTLGKKVLEQRLNISAHDQDLAKSVDNSLHNLEEN